MRAELHPATGGRAHAPRAVRPKQCHLHAQAGGGLEGQWDGSGVKGNNRFVWLSAGGFVRAPLPFALPVRRPVRSSCAR